MKVFKCNIDGRIEKLVAAKSKKEAASKINVTLKHFLKYGHETGAVNDRELVLNNPEKVYKKDILGSMFGWVEEIVLTKFFKCIIFNVRKTQSYNLR